MKIELEDSDKRYIELVKSGEANQIIVSEVGEKMYLGIEIIDIPKAANFILSMFGPSDRPRVQKMEEALGIRLLKINFSEADERIGELKRELESFLEKLNEI